MYLQIGELGVFIYFHSKKTNMLSPRIKKKIFYVSISIPWALLQSNREKFSNLYNSVQYFYAEEKISLGKNNEMKLGKQLI